MDATDDDPGDGPSPFLLDDEELEMARPIAHDYVDFSRLNMGMGINMERMHSNMRPAISGPHDVFSGMSNTCTGQCGMGWQQGGATRYAYGYNPASPNRSPGSGLVAPSVSPGPSGLGMGQSEAKQVKPRKLASLEEFHHTRDEQKLVGVNTTGGHGSHQEFTNPVSDILVFHHNTPQG